jgi:hypothetical protein
MKKNKEELKTNIIEPMRSKKEKNRMNFKNY